MEMRAAFQRATGRGEQAAFCTTQIRHFGPILALGCELGRPVEKRVGEFVTYDVLDVVQGGSRPTWHMRCPFLTTGCQPGHRYPTVTEDLSTFKQFNIFYSPPDL